MKRNRLGKMVAGLVGKKPKNTKEIMGFQTHDFRGTITVGDQGILDHVKHHAIEEVHRLKKRRNERYPLRRGWEWWEDLSRRLRPAAGEEFRQGVIGIREEFPCIEAIKIAKVMRALCCGFMEEAERFFREENSLKIICSH